MKQDISRHPIFLRFRTKELEQLFTEEYFPANLTALRIALFLGILIFSGFVGVDLMFNPESLFYVLLIRLGVAVPWIAGMLCICITPWMKNQIRLEVVGFSALLGGHLAHIALVIMVPELPSHYLLHTTNILAFFAYSIACIRFTRLLLFGSVALVTFLIYLLVYDWTSFADTFFQLNVLISINTVGLFAGYVIEGVNRDNFVKEIAISEQKDELEQQRKDLQVEKSFSEAISKLSPNIIYILEFPSGKPIYTNKEGLAFIGKVEKGIEDLRPDIREMIIHPDDVEYSKNRFHEHYKLKGRETLEFSQRILHIDGTWRWIMLREGVFERDEDGNIVKIIGVANDITDIKSVETILRRKNAELSQFGYIVSHDLKSPLRGISTLVDFIKDDLELNKIELPEEVKVNFSLINKRILRMEALIKGILAYSKAGGEEELEEIALEELIRSVSTSLFAPPGYSIQIQSPMPSIVFGRISAIQVFQNLISNAIKYNTSPKPELSITAEIRDDGFVWIIFKDNGPGIAGEFHAKIFNMFENLETRESHENTGIGLPIAKKIIEKNHGSIMVESEPGKGASFIVRIPQVRPKGEPNLDHLKG